MMRKIPISVVIPVRNEALNLPRCLAALSRFDEIIVVDSASTDQTCALAREAGAEVLDFQWDGGFPKKRNWVLMNHTLRHPWVLFLDADEIVTEAFCTEIENTIKDTPHAGFWLKYTTYFLGCRLRHGVPQRKLALFRVGAGFYERIDEKFWSRLDMEVHEHPVLVGSVGSIDAPIDHNDDRGIVKFIDRHRDYALWEAQRYRKMRAEPERNAGLTPRQRTKYRYLDRWWYPFAYGIYQYIVRLGFLDGYAGLQYAFYKTWYFNTVQVLIRTPMSLSRSGEGAPP
jgi:glycosyltransferase involved in cell wall biosynthesis